MAATTQTTSNGHHREYMDTQKKIKAMRRSMVNARSEKILDDKRSFWHRNPQDPMPHTRNRHLRTPGDQRLEEIKYPITIEIKRPSLCFVSPASITTIQRRLPILKTGEMRGMFTLITRAANSVMRQIHNSGDNAFGSPLLPKEMELEWLRPISADERDKERSCPSELPADQLV